MRSVDSYTARRGSRSVVFEPRLDEWPDTGVYQLWLRLPANLRVTVGRLGRFTFPAGVYIYSGRASRGLKARVSRHANGGEHKHWHIDHLLVHPRVRLERVVLASLDPQMECVVNQALGREATCVAPGFGASDCKNGCPAHLWLCQRASGQRSRPETD